MGLPSVENRIKRVDNFRWIGCGIYTAAEASRLTGISAGRIRRWMEGYTFARKGEVRTSPPVLSRGLEAISESEAVTLSFRDLIEVMCVSGFLSAGVRWPRLRKAHEKAAKVLGNDHPFASRRFLTDGYSVLLNIDDKFLLDLVSDQFALFEVLRPYLKTDGIDFADEFAARWWPMGKRKPVFVDGRISFGQPVVTQGVPTLVLYRAYLAERRSRTAAAIRAPIGATIDQKTVLYVADWYSVASRSVRAAVEYEARLAALNSSSTTQCLPRLSRRSRFSIPITQ
jgi:Putative DNA-binding HTH domain